MEQLIPGIPNAIALDHIAPKLPWRAFHILSSVSHGWLHAIRTHEVYDARIRSESTEPLVLLIFTRPNDTIEIALYSTRDNSFYDLPPIPALPAGIPVSCEFTSMDGKIYVLGGELESVHNDAGFGNPGSDAVYVLDLAGQRHWEKCASMKEGRAHFGCGVVDGKMFVLGGASSFRPVCGSEVYDPKENVWYPIEPMRTLRYGHRVGIVRGELVVYDGRILDRDYFQSTESPLVDPVDSDDEDEGWRLGYSWEIYNPIQDQWRELMPSAPRADLLFMHGGKIYSIGHLDIHVRDGVGGNEWAHLHSFTFAVVGIVHFVGPIEFRGVFPYTVLVVDGELLAIVRWLKCPERIWEYCLLRSKGFESGSKELVWQKVQFPLPFADFHGRHRCNDMYPLQL